MLWKPQLQGVSIGLEAEKMTQKGTDDGGAEETIFARPGAARTTSAVVTAAAETPLRRPPAPPGASPVDVAVASYGGSDPMRPSPFLEAGGGHPADDGLPSRTRAPRPGRPAPPAPPARRDASNALYAALDVYRYNPSLGLAAPIFDLLASIAATTDAPDVEWLHQTLVEGLQDFESQAAAYGLSSRHVRVTLYALAATVDDGILKTNWGKDSFWSSKSMISMFFQETWGGERFFLLLQQMKISPQAALKELEFFYYCLEFGFEGKYRLAANGAGELGHLREEIFQILRSSYGAVKTELSPKWHGVSIQHHRLREMLPVWFGASALLVIMFFAFIQLSSVLRRDTAVISDKVMSLLASPIPHPVVTLPTEPPVVEPAAPVVRPPAPPPTPPIVTAYEIVSKFLEPEQKAGVLQVLKSGDQVVIRTVGEVFATASTTIRTPFIDVLTRVAQALMKTNGPVVVIGYSDNVPIRTAAFPDNLALSQARAGRASDFLAAAMGSPLRLSATGRGAADPIATNSTPEGRQANRRLEIVLTPQ